MSSKIPDLSNLKISEDLLKGVKQEPIHKTIERDRPFIESVEGILEILDEGIIPIFEKLGLKFIDCQGKKFWFDVGFEDYDEIEFIMEVEKLYNVDILDVAAEKFHHIEPNLVWSIVVQKMRNDKISKIID